MSLRRLWPYAAVTLLAVIAAEPVLRPAMTCSDDGPFHVFRAVELASLIQLGHLFPRWSPHMAQGYGYPFYTFYAPLSSYFVVLLHYGGLDFQAALKLAFALGIWLAGLSAFVFVRGRWGERAGLAAAAAYLLAPYLAFDVLYRANFAEAFAFVWPPLILLALDRGMRAFGRSQKSDVGRQHRGGADAVSQRSDARDQPRSTLESSPSTLPSPSGRGGLLPSSVLRRSSFVLRLAERLSVVRRPSSSSILYAALVLTHNALALLTSPLLAGYVVLRAAQQRSWRALAWGAGSLGLGLALSAYFWLPALAEQRLVHSDRLLVPPIFTWYTNFISGRELLAAPRAADPLLINPSPAKALGLVPALLCLPAIVWAVRRALARLSRRRGGRPAEAPGDDLEAATIGFFAAALAGYAALTLPLSTPVWQVLKPLQVVQFPWRMLGPAALCAAVLIGASVRVLERWLRPGPRPAAPGTEPARMALPLLAVATLLLASNLSWWYPRYCPFGSTGSVADMLAYETATATIGTTAKGEFLPLTADYVPGDDSLAQALRSGQEPSRLSLDAGQAVVTSPAPRDPLEASFTVDVSTATNAVYRQFYYPGWRVTVDGRPAAITPSAGEGLISFPLAAGHHLVRVRFGLTPLRAAAIAISLLALAAVLAVSLAAIRRSRKGGSETRPYLPPHTLTHSHTYILLFFALLVLLKLLVIDRTTNPLRRSALDPATQTLEAAQTPLPADFAGGIHLYGYDLSARTLPADEAADLALYVAQRVPSLRSYWPGVALEDQSGVAWHEHDPLPPRWHREPPNTPEWPPDHYAQWARHITLLPGTPPGAYELYGWVFDRGTLEMASVLDEAGNAVAPRLDLGELQVTRPRRPFHLEPPRPAEHSFGPISLLGYDLDRDGAAAGETVLLILYWRSDQATAQDWTAHISLRNAQGREAYAEDVPPASSYGTSQWQPGDQWRGQRRLRLPAALPEGDYTLVVSLAGAAGGEQPLGRLHVTAPVRSFVRPPVAVAGGAAFGQVAVLEGYSLERAAGALTVRLAWRALGSPPVSYAAFVHLADANGRVWAQSDAVPADWTRPTTGWLAGEYILDEHRLSLPADLPAGAYTLWAGLYDPQTGERLPASGPGAAADQRVSLGPFIWP